MPSRRFHAVLLLMLCLSAAPAAAHKPSDSHLSLTSDGAVVSGQWDIALRDLDHAIGLDADADDAITWGEVLAQHQAIAAYALARLRLSGDGAECTSRPLEQLIDHHSDGAYAVLRFVSQCPQAPQQLAVDYRLFFDLDPQHRGIVQVTTGAVTRPLLFSAEAPQQVLRLSETGHWHSLVEFWREGVWHIWTGYDHVLFILALLLPAVLRREAGAWQVVDNFGAALRTTLKVVTAFTLAHSLTLALATLEVVSLPSRLVESAIAASVVLAALNNAVPLFSDGRWAVGFGFGLLHGFGFASVLSDPGMPHASLLLALFGFNAGVETGQVLIVALFLPLAYSLRHAWVYQRLTLLGGSLAIATLAGIWLVERSLDVVLLP